MLLVMFADLPHTIVSETTLDIEIHRIQIPEICLKKSKKLIMVDGCCWKCLQISHFADLSHTIVAGNNFQLHFYLFQI